MYQYTGYYLDDDIVMNRTFDVFMPEKITQKTVLFFVHGGGWTGGVKDDYHRIMREYCRRGFVCGSTSYRLIPIPGKSKLTAVDQLQDVRECYDAFVSVLKEKNIKPDIAVFGTSAGSHLASLLVCAFPGDCGDQCKLKNEWIQPKCGLLQSNPATFEPWPEAYPAMWGMMERAAGGVYKEEPEKFRNISLVRFINKDNPPLFFMEAEIEGLFPRQYNEEILEQHKNWGIPSTMKIYPYAEHGFFYDTTRPIQMEALEDIQNYIHSLED